MQFAGAVLTFCLAVHVSAAVAAEGPPVWAIQQPSTIETRPGFAARCVRRIEGQGPARVDRTRTSMMRTEAADGDGVKVTIRMLHDSDLWPETFAETDSPIISETLLKSGAVVSQDVKFRRALPAGRTEKTTTDVHKAESPEYFIAPRLAAQQGAAISPEGGALQAYRTLARTTGGTTTVDRNLESVAGESNVDGRPAIVIDMVLRATFIINGSPYRMDMDGRRFVDRASGLVITSRARTTIAREGTRTNDVTHTQACTIEW